MTKEAQKRIENLKRPVKLTAEQKVELESLILPMVIFQEYPDIALLVLSGLRIVPAHEATILYAMNYGAPTSVVEASRGTSKTATVANLFATLKAVLFPGKKIATLSSVGFRGGQTIFNDTEKFLNGGWDSQDSDALFLRDSCMDPTKPVHRGANMWTMNFENYSTNYTMPTNNPEKLRGNRAHIVIVDEANIIEWSLVDEVVDAFLNVGTDFEHGGAKGQSNQIIFTSTIDFNWRPYQNMIKAAINGLEKEYLALKHLSNGNVEEYKYLERQGLHGYQYIRFDYTDVLIREFITNREGKTFRVSWPDERIPLTEDVLGIPFTERDENGDMLPNGSPVSYYSSYAIVKQKLEQPLIDGTADLGSWLAEQRNIKDTSQGDVYSHLLVDMVCNEGQFCIQPYQKCPDNYKTAFLRTEQDYTAPVLYECSDPCVLGVDYARESDFAAFVIIRLGPCATGPYNYLTHHGNTPWMNVIWAEQHRNMTHKDVADKIREFTKRYNLAYYHEDYVTDSWLICRAIGLDMRGGGNGVRDKLAFLDESEKELTVGAYRIYDPNDRDDRIQAFASDKNSRPMLDAIWPSAELNDRMVTFTVAQMEQKLLFIGKYINKMQRSRVDNRLDAGYDGVNGLNYQLRRIKSEPGASWRRFFVEGDTSKTTNKKDYWAAFLYAAKQARAHIIRNKTLEDAPPPMAAVVAQINRYSTGKRIAGVKDGFSQHQTRRYL